MPQFFVACHQWRHHNVPAIWFGGNAQKHQFQCDEKVDRDLQFTFFTGMVERGLYLVTQPAAVSFLIG